MLIIYYVIIAVLFCFTLIKHLELKCKDTSFCYKYHYLMRKKVKSNVLSTIICYYLKMLNKYLRGLFSYFILLYMSEQKIIFAI